MPEANGANIAGLYETHDESDDGRADDRTLDQMINSYRREQLTNAENRLKHKELFDEKRRLIEVDSQALPIGIVSAALCAVGCVASRYWRSLKSMLTEKRNH